MIRILSAVTALAVTLISSRPPALAITIDTVYVGNAGNAGDTEVMFDGSTGYGAVAYNYRIGTTEVTVGQYTAFLNAVARSDTYGLYNTAMATDLNVAGIARTGSSGTYHYKVIGSANKPVTYVSWGDTVRFANWLHNGQPTGPQNASTTEAGAYSVNGATTAEAFIGVSRNAGAKWFLPSEQEWYKAAYHKNDGVTGNYWDYPTSTDEIPYSDQPPGSGAPTSSNTVNFKVNDSIANGYNDGYAVTGSPTFHSSQNYLTDAGAYTQSVSPYGTYDQAGNAFEWNEARIGGLFHGMRGGNWFSPPSDLVASFRWLYYSTDEYDDTGFRVATVPEPSTVALAALGVAAIIAYDVRRCTRLALQTEARK